MNYIKHVFYLISLLILSSMLFVSCSDEQEIDTLSKIEEEGKLRIGTDATYPPFETVNARTGEIEGFDIDLMGAICAEMGVEPEYIVTPFDGIIPGLLDHKYDVIISAMTMTPQRAEKVAFTDPYYWASQAIAVKSNERSIRSKKDLAGKKIGAQLGTTGEIVAKRIPEAEVISFDNIGAAFIDLENGKIDAIINDKPTTQRIISAKGGAKIVGEPLTSERYGIAVRPEDKKLLRRINSALAIIDVSGNLERLRSKWFK